MSSAAPDRDVLLLGAGHAHLHLVARAREFAARGGRLVVVSESDAFWYSGLATGVLGGRHAPAADRIDVARLAARSGARFVRGRVVGLDPAARVVRLEGGGELSYGLVSVNLGSVVAPGRVPGAAGRAVPAKPVEGLLALGRALTSSLPARPDGAPAPDDRTASTSTHGPAPGDGASSPTRLVVIGAGASGCEIALAAVAARTRGRDGPEGGGGGAATPARERPAVPPPRSRAASAPPPSRRPLAVTVVTAEARPLHAFGPGASGAVRRALARAGVRLVTDDPVVRVHDHVLDLRSGGSLPWDLLVDASGLAPSPVVAAFGLPLDPQGALRVTGELRSPADERVFGAGDAVALEGRPLPRVGVYAVRQAPVLAHNLLAMLDGRPLRTFRPRRRILQILNLGDGTALAVWGRLHYRGRAAMALKDRLDLGWLARYGG